MLCGRDFLHHFAEKAAVTEKPGLLPNENPVTTFQMQEVLLKKLQDFCELVNFNNVVSLRGALTVKVKKRKRLNEYSFGKFISQLI